jgi:hypothetical protein
LSGAHTRAHLNDISVICPVIPEKLTQYYDPDASFCVLLNFTIYEKKRTVLEAIAIWKIGQISRLLQYHSNFSNVSAAKSM